MRTRIIESILIGLSLILSTFISTVSIVQKIVYAQVNTQTSSNGVPVLNSMTQRSTVVGSNAEPRQNIAVQGKVAGALSSDGRSKTNGPQAFAQGTHSVDVSKVAQKIVRAVGVGVFLKSIYAFIHAGNHHPPPCTLCAR
jgi:hypothetical protein